MKKKKFVLISGLSLMQGEVVTNQKLGMWVELTGNTGAWCAGKMIKGTEKEIREQVNKDLDILFKTST